MAERRRPIDARTNTQTLPRPSDPFERDRGRLGRYREARDFIERKQWKGQPRAREEQPVHNYALTLCRKAISYVFPEAVTFTVPAVGGETEEQTAAVEKLLADTLGELDADELDFAVALESAILGDGAVKVTWDAKQGKPRLTAVDPATLAADWSPDTPAEPWRIHQRYKLPGLTLLERDLISKRSQIKLASLYDVDEAWTVDHWSMTVAGTTTTVDNPYGWIPYLIWPNNRQASEFWGHSDLEDMYDVFRMVNTRTRDLDNILAISGFPITVLENVEGSEGIRVGAGAKWELPEGAKAYLLNLLEGQGVRLHIDFIDTLYRVMHDLSESPRTAFGDSGRDLSGAALEVEIQPLVQKVKRKRRGGDRFYRRRNAMLLDLLEKFGGAQTYGLRQTKTVWPPILPSDEETQVSLVSQQVGNRLMSHRTGMAKLGSTDPEREQKLILEEDRALQQIAQEAEQLAAENPDREEGEGGKRGDAEPEPDDEDTGEDRANA